MREFQLKVEDLDRRLGAVCCQALSDAPGLEQAFKVRRTHARAHTHAHAQARACARKHMRTRARKHTHKLTLCLGKRLGRNTGHRESSLTTVV